MSNLRERAIAGLKRGDSFTVSRRFTEQDMVVFADVGRDYNPVHFDERFAKVKNFRAPVCHGLLVASMLTEIGGQLGWLASGMNFRFRRPVYPGDTIECCFTITELNGNRAEAVAAFTNQQGETVIEASVAGIIPGLPERQVMEAMVAEGDPTNKWRA